MYNNMGSKNMWAKKNYTDHNLLDMSKSLCVTIIYAESVITYEIEVLYNSKSPNFTTPIIVFKVTYNLELQSAITFC